MGRSRYRKKTAAQRKKEREQLAPNAPITLVRGSYHDYTRNRATTLLWIGLVMALAIPAMAEEASETTIESNSLEYKEDTVTSSTCVAPEGYGHQIVRDLDAIKASIFEQVINAQGLLNAITLGEFRKELLNPSEVIIMGNLEWLGDIPHSELKNERDENGGNLWHTLARYPHTLAANKKLARFLLKHNITPSDLDNLSRSPLFYGVAGNNIDFVKMYVGLKKQYYKEEAVFYDPMFFSSLDLAIVTNNIPITKLLLNAGYPVKPVALYYALTKKNIELFKLLALKLEANRSKDIFDVLFLEDDSITAMIFACEQFDLLDWMEQNRVGGFGFYDLPIPLREFLTNYREWNPATKTMVFGASAIAVFAMAYTLGTNHYQKIANEYKKQIEQNDIENQRIEDNKYFILDKLSKYFPEGTDLSLIEDEAHYVKLVIQNEIQPYATLYDDPDKQPIIVYGERRRFPTSFYAGELRANLNNTMIGQLTAYERAYESIKINHNFLKARDILSAPLYLDEIKKNIIEDLILLIENAETVANYVPAKYKASDAKKLKATPLALSELVNIMNGTNTAKKHFETAITMVTSIFRQWENMQVDFLNYTQQMDELAICFDNFTSQPNENISILSSVLATFESHPIFTQFSELNRLIDASCEFLQKHENCIHEFKRKRHHRNHHDEAGPSEKTLTIRQKIEKKRTERLAATDEQKCQHIKKRASCKKSRLPKTPMPAVASTSETPKEKIINKLRQIDIDDETFSPLAKHYAKLFYLLRISQKTNFTRTRDLAMHFFEYIEFDDTAYRLEQADARSGNNSFRPVEENLNVLEGLFRDLDTVRTSNSPFCSQAIAMLLCAMGEVMQQLFTLKVHGDEKAAEIITSLYQYPDFRRIIIPVILPMRAILGHASHAIDFTEPRSLAFYGEYRDWSVPNDLFQHIKTDEIAPPDFDHLKDIFTLTPLAAYTETAGRPGSTAGR